MKLCIDLCSGFKGFSRAFQNNEDWEIITVDIDPKFSPTICADIRKLSKEDIEKTSKLKSFEKYETVIVLASPPCERFSLAPHAWPLPGIRDALEVVGACLELIIAIKPRYWLLENPATGRLRWFIGAPRNHLRLNAYGYATVKPTALWGNIPLALAPYDSSRVNDSAKKFQNYYSKNRARRAEMPLGLSKSVLEAVE
jgi:hypothetical protein